MGVAPLPAIPELKRPGLIEGGSGHDDDRHDDPPYSRAETPGPN